MMEIYMVNINDDYKENFLKLFLFVFYNINKYIFSRFYLLLLLVWTIFNFSNLMMLLIFALFVFLSFSLSLEEVFHAAILIIQGRKDEVNSLCFNILKIRKVKIIAIGVTMYFKGKITENDILYISLCGPLISLVVGIMASLIFVLVEIIMYNSFNSLLYLCRIVLLGFLFLPVTSFVPLNIGITETDGYKILKIKRKFKIKNRSLLRASYNSLRYSISYIRYSIKRSN